MGEPYPRKQKIKTTALPYCNPTVTFYRTQSMTSRKFFVLPLFTFYFKTPKQQTLSLMREIPLSHVVSSCPKISIITVIYPEFYSSTHQTSIKFVHFYWLQNFLDIIVLLVNCILALFNSFINYTDLCCHLGVASQHRGLNPACRKPRSKYLAPNPHHHTWKKPQHSMIRERPYSFLAP